MYDTIGYDTECLRMTLKEQYAYVRKGISKTKEIAVVSFVL